MTSKLPCTPSWLARFRIAYDALPHGEKQLVAEYAGCSGSLLSRTYNDEVDSSEFFAKISERLKIAPPAVEVDSVGQAELLKATSGLSPEDMEILMATARRLAR